MGRGLGGSKSYGKRTPGGIRTSSKMSKIGEVEAKHGVLGEDSSQTDGDARVEGGFVDTARNLTARQIDEARGTNDGGTYESADGKKNYVKMYYEPGQAYGEAVANNIYNALGIRAPKSVVFDPDSPDEARLGRGVANEFYEGETLRDKGRVTAPEIAHKILDGTAADILVANWDAIGLVRDNILVTPEGEPIRIDNGGALLYRAMADSGEKPTFLLNGISEWDVFSNDGSRPGVDNPSYAKVLQAAGYQSLDDMIPRLREQVQRINELAENTNDFEDLVPIVPGVNHKQRDRILEMMRARRGLLNEKVGEGRKAVGLGGTSKMEAGSAITDADVARAVVDQPDWKAKTTVFQEKIANESKDRRIQMGIFWNKYIKAVKRGEKIDEPDPEQLKDDIEKWFANSRKQASPLAKSIDDYKNHEELHDAIRWLPEKPRDKKEAKQQRAEAKQERDYHRESERRRQQALQETPGTKEWTAHMERLDRELKKTELIHYGNTKYDPAKVTPVKNGDGSWYWGAKPYSGGFWLSPANSNYGWERYVETDMDDSKSLAQSFSIKLDPKAKVFIIDSLADLELAPSRRIGDHVVMDFEALAKKYDVIWLTEKGMWDTRGSAPGQPTTYGWDCETVYVMNPDVVKPV